MIVAYPEEVKRELLGVPKIYADIEDLRSHAGVAPEVIKHYNPTLRPPVYRSGKRIPRGYVLRLPAGTLGPDPEKWLASNLGY